MAGEVFNLEFKTMKKTVLRIFSIVMAAVMIVITATVATGCGNGETVGYEPPDYVFVPEITGLPALPDDYEFISNVVIADDILYFTAMRPQYADSQFVEATIFSVEIDGTELTNPAQLPDYTPLSPPDGAEAGYAVINALHVDCCGYLWVAEAVAFYTFDLPAGFDADRDDKWEYYELLELIHTIRKLDSTGAEILSVDMGNLSFAGGSIGVTALNIDSTGNIYIGSGSVIFVIDIAGNILFSLEASGFVAQLIRLGDGTIAFHHALGNRLRRIDAESRAWGEDVELPMNARHVFSGDDEYLVFFDDGTYLSGLEAKTGEVVQLLSWIENDVTPGMLGNLAVFPDSSIRFTSLPPGQYPDERDIELVLLNLTPYTYIPERAVLTLATISPSAEIQAAVSEFNRTNQAYRIDMIDYRGELSFAEAVTQMNLDIMTGRIPDIIDLTRLPYQTYAARGLLLDLYPFIDADPVLNRSDLFESVLHAAEIDGALYVAFPTFTINTIVGHPAVLGDYPGWTLDEMMSVLEDNPQADLPMGPEVLSARDFLHLNLGSDLERFVDREAGLAFFDSDEFIQLLEVAQAFEIDFEIGLRDLGGGAFTLAPEYEFHRLIAAGRMIMAPVNITGFFYYQIYRAMFGGDLVIKGYPSFDRAGNTISLWNARWRGSGIAGLGMGITSGASDKQGAWEFVRTFLTEDWQRSNTNESTGEPFPTNRVVFDEMAAIALEEPLFLGLYGDFSFYPEAFSQDERDQIIAMIESVSVMSSTSELFGDLRDIVFEGADDFFSGRTTAEDAARVIQSRASIYIAEQMG